MSKLWSESKPLLIKRLTSINTDARFFNNWCYLLGLPKTASTEPMRLTLIILVFVSSILLAGTTASAGISTKKQDILKLIGTSYAFNGKFAWIELNGVDYGWTREGGNVGKYRIVLVEMGKVKLVLHGKVMEFEMDYYESPEKVNKTLWS